MTIGQRTYTAVIRKADESGTSVLQECARIGIEPQTVKEWRRRNNPSAYYLQQLALAGYDIMWILVGDEDEKRD